MKIWFNLTDPTVVTSIGKTVGDLAVEGFIDYDGEFIHGHDSEFYTVSGGTLIPKSQAEVDTIKSSRALHDSDVLTRMPGASTKLKTIASVAKSINSVADASAYIDSLPGTPLEQARTALNQALFALAQLIKYVLVNEDEFH